MARRHYYTFVLLVALLSIIPAQASELQLWKGKPIAVDLSVGKTRIVDFGQNVRFNAIAAIQSGKLEAFSLQGKLYLTPSESFPIERLRVSFMDTGLEILLDVSAIKSKNELSDLTIRYEEELELPATTQLPAETALPPLGPVDMLRYASLDSYAPERLKKTDPRFSDYRVDKSLDLSELFIGQSYGLYESKLIKAWQVEGLYLTVVGVRNLSAIQRQLNLFDLNLEATLATPQRIFLAPQNSLGDSTRFYVITKAPFEQALGRTPLIVAGG